MRFTNDFHSWLRHSWKSLANRLTRDPKSVIHNNSYIILYVMYAPSQWETASQCNTISHCLGIYTEWSLARILPPWLIHGVLACQWVVCTRSCETGCSEWPLGELLCSTRSNIRLAPFISWNLWITWCSCFWAFSTRWHFCLTLWDRVTHICQ